ncbi:adenosylmethionine decarboxylase [Neisseria iguanae]|uniref:Adenosylmethionine decarboxylase n=1 Tax=Neisseria iguanae TaxID=90242 RepID=A0A2P7TZG6_9NEIS|nr:adenosylmethionine decarboxylase [Neisseria iguanae]PSJ80126.1 adenosylmethionine decarboxylase [Neisseria iguanae]
MQSENHGLLDLYGCHVEALKDEGCLKGWLTEAAQAAGATILGSHFHSFGGEGGVTGVLLLAESHISIHTWPEHGFAAVDAFICGSSELETVRRILQKALQATHSEWTVQRRGSRLA